MWILKSWVNLVVVATLSALTACGGTEAQPPAPAPAPAPSPQPPITLVKLFEGKQCETRGVTSVTISKELVDAGVAVNEKSCPFDADAITSTGCGTPTKGYVKIEIQQDQEQRAQALGYKQASAFPPLTASACPP